MMATYKVSFEFREYKGNWVSFTSWTGPAKSETEAYDYAYKFFGMHQVYEIVNSKVEKVGD